MFLERFKLEINKMNHTINNNSQPSKESESFVSGGRNPNWEACCYTCSYQIQDKEHYGWGWCSIRNNASVSPHGGCDKHFSSLIASRG